MDNNKDEYKDFSELIDESKADLSSYIETRLELAKLNTIEKASSLASHVIYGLMMSVFGLILFILILIGLGFLFGEIMNSPAAGFGILILLTFALLFILVMNAKKIRRSFLNMALRTIKKIETDEE